MSRQLTRSGAASQYFKSRADTYELGPGSWHAELAQDLLVRAPIHAGQRVLDLACGTGLVSIPAAVAAGLRGEVVAVDISSAMLEVARHKQEPAGSAPIERCEADIADLGGLSRVQRTVAEGGFDLITCCSPFVYLGDRAGAIRHWFGLLKEGGRLIVDAPTEEGTVQHVSATSFRDITGIVVPAGRG